MIKKFFNPIVLSVMVGVLEILLVVELHRIFSAWELVGLYLLTTALGIATVVTVGSGDKNQPPGKKASKRLGAKIKAKHPLTEKESELAAKMMQEMIYVMAFFFVIIPGILTDFLGLLMVLPFSTRWMREKLLASLKAPS